jgi:hypothetical protein
MARSKHCEGQLALTFTWPDRMPVHCTNCAWTGQRKRCVASLARPCPSCAGRVRRGRPQVTITHGRRRQNGYGVSSARYARLALISGAHAASSA